MQPAYDHKMQPACRLHTIVCRLHPISYAGCIRSRMQAAYDLVCRLHTISYAGCIRSRMQAAYDLVCRLHTISYAGCIRSYAGCILRWYAGGVRCSTVWVIVCILHAGCIRAFAFGRRWNTLVPVVIYKYL